jgi:hypothetical protein
MPLKSHAIATYLSLTRSSSGNCSPIESAALQQFVCQCVPCYCTKMCLSENEHSPRPALFSFCGAHVVPLACIVLISYPCVLWDMFQLNVILMVLIRERLWKIWGCIRDGNVWMSDASTLCQFSQRKITKWKSGLRYICLIVLCQHLIDQFSYKIIFYEKRSNATMNFCMKYLCYVKS